jgi:hypothetical protein
LLNLGAMCDRYDNATSVAECFFEFAESLPKIRMLPASSEFDQIDTT